MTDGQSSGANPRAAHDEILARLDDLGERIAVISRRFDDLVAPIPPPRFLSLDEAARYASLSRKTIDRLIAFGDLTPHYPVDGRKVIDRVELDNVILGATRQPRNGRGSGGSRVGRPRGGNA